MHSLDTDPGNSMLFATDLSIRSDFFPEIGAPQQTSHLFSCTTVSWFGDFPLSEAPGISVSFNIKISPFGGLLQSFGAFLVGGLCFTSSLQPNSPSLSSALS